MTVCEPEDFTARYSRSGIPVYCRDRGGRTNKKEWSAANVHHGTGGVEHSFVVYKKSECCIQKKSESSWTISSEYDIISNGILDWMTA